MNNLRSSLAKPLLVALVLAASGGADAARNANRPVPELPYDSALPVEIHLGQQELTVDAQQTNAAVAGGGLLGVLIVSAVDNAAAKKDELRIGAVRDLLLGADLNAHFLQAIESGLDAALFAQALEVQTHAQSRAARLSGGELASYPRVLDLELGYALSADFRALKVSVDLFIGPRRIKGKRQEETKMQPYRFLLQSLTPLPGDHNKLKQDERAAMWAALGREQLEAILLSSMEEVVQLANHAIARLPETKAGGERIRFRYGVTAGSGRVEKSMNGRSWLRLGQHQLVSVPR